jgi:hypothetical protein
MARRKLIHALDKNTTKQQVFDYITAFLLKQGRQALDSDKTTYCKLRGAGGTMCAAGCILPDSLYDSQLEGLSFDEVVEYVTDDDLHGEAARPWVQLIAPFESMICDLQETHDEWDDDLRESETRTLTEYWTDCFRRLAADHGLKFDPTLYKTL